MACGKRVQCQQLIVRVKHLSWAVSTRGEKLYMSRQLSIWAVTLPISFFLSFFYGSSKKIWRRMKKHWSRVCLLSAQYRVHLSEIDANDVLPVSLERQSTRHSVTLQMLLKAERVHGSVTVVGIINGSGDFIMGWKPFVLERVTIGVFWLISALGGSSQFWLAGTHYTRYQKVSNNRQ